MRSIYQDRLGTKIGKLEQQESFFGVLQAFSSTWCSYQCCSIARPGEKNGLSKAIYTFKCSFYQDMLGTNIWKALKNRLPFCCTGEQRPTVSGRRRSCKSADGWCSSTRIRVGISKSYLLRGTLVRKTAETAATRVS